MSLARHWQDLRRLHRGLPSRNGDDVFAAVGAIQFNINGYAHEIEKARIEAVRNRDADTASARPAAAGSQFQHKLPSLDLTHRARDGFAHLTPAG